MTTPAKRLRQPVRPPAPVALTPTDSGLSADGPALVSPAPDLVTGALAAAVHDPIAEALAAEVLAADAARTRDLMAAALLTPDAPALPADDPIETAQTFATAAEAMAADDGVTPPDLSGEPVELTRGEYLLYSMMQAVIEELQTLHTAVAVTGQQVQYTTDTFVDMKTQFDQMMAGGNPLKMLGSLLGKKGF